MFWLEFRLAKTYQGYTLSKILFSCYTGKKFGEGREKGQLGILTWIAL